jgi:integrase/recombinase XerD
MTRYAKEFLTFDEVQLMTSVPDLSERDEIIILLLYAPALRVSEMLNLRVADLDIKNETITIRGGKGYDVTDLDVVPCDVKILRKVLRYCEHEKLKQKDFVIQSNMGKSMHRSQVYRILNNIAGRAGISKTIGTHTFRRSRATNLLNAGIDVADVSRLLRHQNLATTMNYLRLSVGDLQRKLKGINDNVGQLC